MRKYLFLLSFLIFLPLCAKPAEDRIWLEAKINGTPVKFAFDTGSSSTVLFPKTAERLGLKVTYALPDAKHPSGLSPMGMTEPFTLTTGTKSHEIRMRVVDIPPYMPMDCDGFVALGDMRQSIFVINGSRLSLVETLPIDLKGWSKWKMINFQGVLRFECTHEKEAAQIVIDTGNPSGVEFNQKRWERWRREHAQQEATMEAVYTPGYGLQVREMFRAKSISVAGLTFKDVPLSPAMPGKDVPLSPAVILLEKGIPDYDAVIGLFALTKLSLIIDGKNSVLYTRPVDHPTAEFSYNRLGAVFVPEDMEKANDLIAHVSQGSPAHRAGIRDGDVLLKIDDLDATHWRTDPKVLPLSRFWEKPAGTKLRLVLKRDGKEYEVTVTLRDLTSSASTP